MYALNGVIRDYPWGSPTAIPAFMGLTVTGEPVAEMWFGAHPSGESTIPELGQTLGQFIDSNPLKILGASTLDRHGVALPYLVKFIAPAAPLSLQVHPSLAQAQDGFSRAQEGGPNAPIDYVDANHKPELLYPLTSFEVLAGFRPAAELTHTLHGLDSPTLVAATRDIARLGDAGISQALARILNDLTAEETRDICAQVAHRLAQGDSPCPHGDDVVTRLYRAYPADNGVVASLLLTPRILQPGQAMFVPAGVIHVYLSGLGVEVMANSDNVLRAGLTPKNVDVDELLSIVNPKANVVFPATQPNLHTTEFPIPVQDFTLTHVDATTQPTRITGQGPRIVLSLGKGVAISTDGTDADTPIGVSRMNLGPGQAAFVASCEGAIEVDGGPVLQTGT